MSNPTLSIIVPIYNASKVLERCLSSILNQTFSDWELLLIDDGSTDESGHLCEEFSLRDKRIRTIHKINGGVSTARNTGLEICNGDYITFIDADDYIESNYFEEMMSEKISDLVICGFKIANLNTFIPTQSIKNVPINAELVTELVENPYYLDSPWCKIFKKSIIKENKIKFDPRLKLSEDTLFSYSYLSHIKTITLIKKSLYVYDGIWGGGSKYVLTASELKYSSFQLIQSIQTLNHKFNINIDVKFKCFHLSKLKHLFTDFTDIDIYNLYIATHPKISIENFLGDNRISPLTIALTIGLRLYREKNIKGVKLHLNNVKNFITIPINRINFNSKKQKLFYSILDIFGVKISSYLFLILSK